MNARPAPIDNPVAEAEGTLTRLQGQVEAMRAVLVRLLQDVVVAESRVAQSDAARLVEANERLVVAAMASMDEADTAAMALEQAQSSAARDALTQLPNRSTLPAQFARAAAHARRRGGRLALLYLDFDDFKRLNDTHGHAFGDKLLCLAAERMLAAVREEDMVSRHGGDEFLVLLADLGEPRDAQAVAEKLIAAVGAPAEVEGHPVRMTVSIGIAIYPDDGDDLDTLLERADLAMYESKRLGAGRFAFNHNAAADGPRPPPAGRPSVAAESEHRSALLRDANEKLLLAALTAQELKAAAEQAQQRQAAFVAAVADELRNPAAPIRIASAMLGRIPDADPLLPRVQGIVEQQLSQMSRLVGDLLDAANTGSGGLELCFGEVDMAKVIAEAVAAHQLMMDQRGQRFESSRPPGVLAVWGDAVRLTQVIGNLLDNASKHTHNGGRISLAATVGADTLTIAVSDNGIGITSEMLPLVFDPFVQDTHAIGFNGVGPGIGLTVVRALVRAHGGRVAAHSAGIGRGSRFVVSLPLVVAAQPARAVPLAPAA